MFELDKIDEFFGKLDSRETGSVNYLRLSNITSFYILYKSWLARKHFTEHYRIMCVSSAVQYCAYAQYCAFVHVGFVGKKKEVIKKKSHSEIDVKNN